MNKLAEQLGLTNHPVAIYRSKEIPADAVSSEIKCGIPSLLMRCVRNGGKYACTKEQIACHGAVGGFGFGGIINRERTCMNMSQFPPGSEGTHHGNGKRYFANPECAKFQIDAIPDIGDGNDCIIFQDLDDAENSGADIEVVVFIVDPTRLTALMQLAAFSRRTEGSASIAPFGHACQQIYAIPFAEGTKDEPCGVIGMTDMFARRFVETGELSYAVPYKLYLRMMNDMNDSFLVQERFQEQMLKALHKNVGEPKN